MVLIYHIFEGFATSPVTQGCNHGYLAVDFFFMLSGFVIAYAYDDRWDKMSVGNFMRRRLIRLHPMVVLGVVIGAIAFIIQGSVRWDGSEVGIWAVAGAAALNICMIPAVPGGVFEVRGAGEMFPLNGPHWTLLFEYIGNIIYAIAIRRLSTRALAGVVIISGIALTALSLSNYSGFYHMGIGWSLSGGGFFAGFIRMFFPFNVGLLMARIFRPSSFKGGFWAGALLLVACMACPYIGKDVSILNAIYELGCIMLLFPAIVWLGASANVTGATSTLCGFLGAISYPVYALHYPLMYLFYSRVLHTDLTIGTEWPLALLIIIGSVLIAYTALKIYDEPLRRRIGQLKY